MPPLDTYAPRLWDYWERNLDPALFRDHSLRGAIEGKKVLITGASSGIGLTTALKIGEAGGEVLLVSRTREKLEEVAEQIRSAGGIAHVHPADLSDMDDLERMADEVIEQHGGIDILINNAGRSIRRSIKASYDRFHDYERTMQLNYYSPLRLIRGLAPGMRDRGDGHIINVSTWGVLSESSPLFAVYNASKAALTAVSRVIETEWSADGVHSTTLFYPLVHTPMVAPTRAYDGLPGLTSAEAADWMITAARTRPVRIAPRMAVTAHAVNSVAPALVDAVMKRQRVQPNS